MTYRYAQIYKHEDGFGYPECDSYLSGEVAADDMIRLPDDFDLTNKRWNYELTDWETYEPDPIPEPEPIEPQPESITLEDLMVEIQKKNSDIETAAIDRYTLELMEEGVL